MMKIVSFILAILVSSSVLFAIDTLSYSKWRGKTFPRIELPHGYKYAGIFEESPTGNDFFSFLDNKEIHFISTREVKSEGRTICVTTYEYQSTQLYVLNLVDNTAQTRHFERVSLSFEGVGVKNPVLVDLMSGMMGYIPQSDITSKKGIVTMKSIPLCSTPVMVATCRTLPRRIVWKEMTPAEIVDSIYKPWENPKGSNKIGLKMDVSNEHWAKMSNDEFLPCFDKYGQFKHREWPGKTHSDQDLKSAISEEAKDLMEFPGATDRNKYGGWLKGPKLKATGRFRTEKVNGKWWLVDPDGCLFWSFGPVRVSTASATTPLNGNTRAFANGRSMPDRDCLFSWLPEQSDPLYEFYQFGKPNKRGQSRYFKFSAANLCRKYGEGWFEKFSKLSHRRIKSWGMNTIANGSDTLISDMNLTPYAERIDIYPVKIRGSWGRWGKFHDPFSPSLAKVLYNQLNKRTGKNNPWCIGYFVDNELQWGKNHEDLARWTLWSPDKQPAKKEFLRRLNAKGISFNSKDPSSVPLEELRAFSNEIVEKYFKTVRTTIKSFDPDLLYLGCRFHSSPKWVLEIAVKYCDVLSWNVYKDDLSGWSPMVQADLPILIGEFHFGAHDRGLFGSGQRNAISQNGRAEAIKRYVRSALEHPLIVGAHWHQYSDQATSGRFDGEHFQVGLTDICDRPYPETIQALREIGYPMYDIRTGK